MSKRLTREENAALPWLHIYAQDSWHQEAAILGTPQALEGLRAAIDRVLQSGMDASSDGFVADGEGFSAVVGIRSLEALEAMALPYYESWASGIDHPTTEPAKAEEP